MTYKNVYEALVAVNAEIQTVAKTAYNDFLKFKYAPIEEVYAVCRDAMAKHGVVLIPQIVENEMTQSTTSKDKTTNYATTTFNYQFFYGESHTEPLRWVGEAMDNGDKTYSKAISFSQKTFLLTFFNIPRTDGDPDSTGTTGQAKPHKHTTQPKYTKNVIFWLNLFGKQNLNWWDKNSQYHEVYKEMCKKIGISAYAKEWTVDTCKLIQEYLAKVGVTINIEDEVNEFLCETIRREVTKDINGGVK